MKALIERQLYRPAVVLPLLILMRLMVTLDFNLMQVTFVVVMKSSQYVLHLVSGAAESVRRGLVLVQVRVLVANGHVTVRGCGLLLVASVGLGLGRCCSRRVWGEH